MKLVNLTPHAVIIVNEVGSLEIEPSGTQARVSMMRILHHTIEVDGVDGVDGVDIKVYISTPGKIIDLPEEQEEISYIVSRVVAEAEKERKDLYFPDDTVRDDKGRIIGCRSLGCL